MPERVYNVLNLGAGIQSSRVLLGACKGELPRFDAAIFADTQWEPKGVYDNLDFLRGEAARSRIPLVVRTAGNIRDDAIEFRRSRRSLDRRRHASLPTFIKNPDGSKGRVRRQCTGAYKIDVVERWIRRELLELAKGQRIPKGVVVRQWFGISDDEGRRATFPGVYREKEARVGSDLFGDPITIRRRTWYPAAWRQHLYPLLNECWRADRTIVEEPVLPHREQRRDCITWLARNYPGRAFPRSACIGCPFRSNAEWREMRADRPGEWLDACDFDESQRQADKEGITKRALLVGVSYIHPQLIPLRMVDLDGMGEKGGGCGTLFDGQDGMCDV